MLNATSAVITDKMQQRTNLTLNNDDNNNIKKTWAKAQKPKSFQIWPNLIVQEEDVGDGKQRRIGEELKTLLKQKDEEDNTPLLLAVQVGGVNETVVLILIVIVCYCYWCNCCSHSYCYCSLLLISGRQQWCSGAFHRSDWLRSLHQWAQQRARRPTPFCIKVTIDAELKKQPGSIVSFFLIE